MRKSRFISYLLFCFIIGVALRSFVRFDPFILFVIGGLGIIGGTLIYNKKRLMAQLLLGSIFIFLGFLRFDLAVHKDCSVNHQSITCLNELEQRLTTEVVAEPDIRETSTHYELSLDNYQGKVLLINESYPQYEIGDKLQIICLLEAPQEFDSFDYPGFLAKSNIYSICRFPDPPEKVDHTSYPVLTARGISQRLVSLKFKFKQIIDQAVSSPQSAFLNSILLGLRREVPQKLQDNFALTGTSHLMAISGLHIVILMQIIFFVLRGWRLKKKQAFWVALVLVTLFIALIGFRASSFRAGIFGLVIMIGFLTQRPKKIINLLLLAASALLLINPMLLRWDVGFQLSFLAVLGLIYLGPYFQRWLNFIPEGYFNIRTILVMTLSAQIMVLPWLLYSFGNLSISAPLVNVLVLPVVPLVMAFGFLLIILGSAWQPLALVVGVLEYFLVGYVLGVINILAAVPALSAQVRLPLWFAFGIYLVMAGFLASQKFRLFFISRWRWLVKRLQIRSQSTQTDEIIQMTISLDDDAIVEEANTPVTAAEKDKTQLQSFLYRLKLSRPLLVLLSSVVTLIILAVFLAQPSSQADLKVITFDVGQGDSHLIMTPGGHSILIDGGPDATVIEKLGKYLPITNKKIDLIVLSHPHADHATGLNEVMKRYQVDRILATGVVHTTNTYREWLELVKDNDITFDQALAGREYVFESESELVVLQVLWPDKDLYGQIVDDLNDTSVVIMLEYGQTRFFFTGDISVDIEARLLSQNWNLEANVLKVAHQGSDTSSSLEFIEAVKPDYAVIPVGENNYGHPSERIIRRLERTDAQVLRTDEHGDIVFVSDGEKVELK